MTLDLWLPYFFACWVIALSPGNGAVISMNHGLNYGLRQTSITILGLQAGLLLIMALAMAGVGTLLLASEMAFSTVKWIGAGYLFYIGWQQWRQASRQPQAESSAAGDKQILGARQRFLYGFLTNATNPKGIVFMVAVLPQFIDPNAPQLNQFICMALTMTTVDLIVMHGYALLAAHLQRWFKSSAAQKIQQRFFGGVLMVAGIGVLCFKRSANGIT
ncbi:LysE family transporter [Parvibium lacunae]|uniref:Lysine transporter LysE n=1 Tax=Parvibium lacunae TaxID=1888893 RepID=A0A368L0M3_9BURK|nr:LysE family transporter [Parvibium lacunae]RCS57113.1 lysine transporter LysE [Parvibium lacunae]